MLFCMYLLSKESIECGGEKRTAFRLCFEACVQRTANEHFSCAHSFPPRIQSEPIMASSIAVSAESQMKLG